jgi:hypothetical protein
VQYVSGISTSAGYWKPFTGGTCIDQDNDVFYWSAAGSMIMGMDLNTGLVVEAGSGNSGEFHFIEHFTGCECLATGTAPVADQAASVSMSADGAMLFVHMPSGSGPARLTLFDGLGRVMLVGMIEVPYGIMSIQELPAGPYFYRLDAPSGFSILASGKLLKPDAR